MCQQTNDRHTLIQAAGLSLSRSNYTQLRLTTTTGNLKEVEEGDKKLLR